MTDIRSATTLDKSFYFDPACFEASKEALFADAWLYLADAILARRSASNLLPAPLLDHYLDEALLIARQQDDSLRCLSNVCTHRAFPLVHHPTQARKIICQYHGRRFDLAGRVEHMPMFGEVEGFPRPCDHLHTVPTQEWQRFLFAKLSGEDTFDHLRNTLDHRLYHMDMASWRHAPEYSKTYAIKCHWALYVENYLEGFHIPFVHDGLNQIIDFGQYQTETYDHAVLQIGYGKAGDPALDLPKDHPDYGKVVTAYYYWLFPNFMLNIYNWGVQINIVRPISPDFCKVDFEYYIGDEEAWQRFGRDGLAEKTEREDEWIVEGVQRGLQSRFYTDGQYAPTLENGVYHFHNMVRDRLGSLLGK